MEFPKYDGIIHPNEWINDIQKYFVLRKIDKGEGLRIAILSVDSIITLPSEIDSFEQLLDYLKKDVSFKVFKSKNERILQSLKYVPERKGGNIMKFISNFRKLCYNAEINDVEKQKEYLYKSLPVDYLDYALNEFHKKMKNVNSISELIEKFDEIALEESKIIMNNSIVTLKHIATGKYLSSGVNLKYTTGSKSQLVFAGSPYPDPNSLWRVNFNNGLATHINALLTLQHVNSGGKFLGIYYGMYNNGTGTDEYCYHKSPSTNHTEVGCRDNDLYYYWHTNWKFNHAKKEDHHYFLKSNDIINLSFKREFDDNGNYDQNGQYEFLRSHDIQFTIERDTFQEVVCHNERLGGNDEWCIELFKQDYDTNTYNKK
ncbi:hypothetical protein RclHR1_13010009 [Rhizophagus clarus]|uniref:MIR domain-containing protein n=1 Tax=Rhizophagus clarus TaxID=94130 RepID=A0A2Z6Q927_9GLOM|nr:hypothetical protein RclHR1_13010009 [Rhizophagus clarus]GES94977.1 hypothetical protein GLOIN_2v1767369 [Rhizophagus clarus]